MINNKAARKPHLVFVEDRAQAEWIKRSFPLDSTTRFVAVTADASQALRECELRHEAVGAYADTRKLAAVERQININTFALAEEIESYMGRRYAEVRFDGPGFMSGQGYYLQFSACALATRAFLMRETIRACSPEVVTVFDGRIDPWFERDGYTRNPWVEVIAALASEGGFRAEVLPGVAPGSELEIRCISDYSTNLLQRAYRYACRTAPRLLQGRQRNNFHLNEAGGLRLMLVDSLYHDWAPVLSALRSANNAECFSIESIYMDNRNWTSHYVPAMRHLRQGKQYKLSAEFPTRDEIETRTIEHLFDDWLDERISAPELNVVGMNLFPALRTHLRAVASVSPAIVRHSDSVAHQALDIAKPHAACFLAMPSLAAKRFAFCCRQHGVQVVSYQHGANYGAQQWVPHEQTELAHADYFLTYGAGVRRPFKPTFPVQTRYVPVGSTRVERMVPFRPGAPSGRRLIRVLWVAAVTTRNTLGGAFDFEDTGRYLLQRQCIEILGRADRMVVTYRPYRHQVACDGTTRWLELAKMDSVDINAVEPLPDLIRRADVVITDTPAVSTSWLESIALRKPFILYSDPEQTRLWPAFMTDLERACYWCKTARTFTLAMHRLVNERWDFIVELQRFETASFRCDYILHREDGQCVRRVISFLNNVCRHGQAIDDWEKQPLGQDARSWRKIPPVSHMKKPSCVGEASSS